jgi:hypothetical protein
MISAVSYVPDRLGEDGRAEVRTFPGVAAGVTADGRTRSADLTPLFDGKVLAQEDLELFDTAGTGTAIWANQSVPLVVTAGQYMIRQTRQYFPYASGYPKFAEITFQDFQLQPGVIKRYGLFSSNAVAPFDQNFDGWYVESNGDDGTYYLVVVNNGVNKLKLPWTEWSGYESVKDYNWENFTVTITDFLWLGGAVLRTFLKTDQGFVLAHQYDYSGGAKGVFMRSPNQPLRYEIRSTTGAGTFTSICSQVAIEGATSVTGKTRSFYNPTTLNANTTGVTYAIRGLRKLAAFRDIPFRISGYGIAVTTNDSGVVLLLRNPTLSAPLTWTTNGLLEEGTATTQTVTDSGWVIGAFPINTAGESQSLENNSMAWLSTAINDTPDEFILAYAPLTTNQSVGGVIDFVQY